MTTPPRVLSLCALGLLAMAGAGAAPPALPTPPAEPPLRLPASVPVLPAETAEERAARVPAPLLTLLDDLEQAGAALRRFEAELIYEKLDVLTDGIELQYGAVVYDRAEAASPPAGARVGVFFREYVDASGRSEKVEQRYVFADGWLVEVDPVRKQFIKRQIVPPGEHFDPLKLGEGPFPLPIGQKRNEVLARFTVEPAPVPGARLLKAIDESAIREGRIRPLRLVPRPGTPEAEDFASVDLYYDRDTLLPVGIVAEGTGGDRKTVRLSKVRRNEALADGTAAALSVETPADTAGWTIDVRPWKP